MKGEYFIFIFIILIIVVAIFNIKTSEGFQPVLRVPESPVAQKNLVDLYTEDIGENLFVPLSGSIATVNSLPYKDPANEKTPLKRILNVQTTLNGFLENAGSTLKDSSDPSIQLPYTSIQSDNKRLKNEILLLKKNPGMESSLTQADLDDIETNLNYLQKKYNYSIYSEGFQNPVADKQRASLADLTTLISRLNSAKISLGSSGTTDPVVQGRINVLGSIQSKVQAIIDDVNAGVRQESQIPIYKKSYEEFLKVIQNNNSPLPALLGQTAPGLADLFPAYSLGDVSGAQFSQYLFDKYAEMLFKGLSWDFTMKYTSEAELENSKYFLDALNNYKQPRDDRFYIQPYPYPYPYDQAPYPMPQNPEQPLNPQNPLNPQQPLNPQNPPIYDRFLPITPSAKPERFNWHERANFICEAIAKHGLDPGSYGCLSETDYVSDDFSWRGYAKMICSRLGTYYDPGLPETCGCPDLAWKGWRAII